MRIVSVLAASILFASVSHPSSSAQPAPQPSPDLPQLIKTAAIIPGDSLLVQAAKQAIRSRSQSTSRFVIDDTRVRRGRVFQASGPEEVSYYVPPPSPTPEADAGGESETDRAARETQARVEALRREQQVVAQEADEGPYGFDMEEDQVEERLSNIPKEIDRLQPQNPPPPPN